MRTAFVATAIPNTCRGTFVTTAIGIAVGADWLNQLAPTAIPIVVATAVRTDYSFRLSTVASRMFENVQNKPKFQFKTQVFIFDLKLVGSKWILQMKSAIDQAVDKQGNWQVANQKVKPPFFY